MRRKIQAHGEAVEGAAALGLLRMTMRARRAGPTSASAASLPGLRRRAPRLEPPRRRLRQPAAPPRLRLRLARRALLRARESLRPRLRLGRGAERVASPGRRASCRASAKPRRHLRPVLAAARARGREESRAASPPARAFRALPASSRSPPRRGGARRRRRGPAIGLPVGVEHARGRIDGEAAERRAAGAGDADRVQRRLERPVEALAAERIAARASRLPL